MTESEFSGVMAAVHNHLSAQHGKPVSVAQLHALWNEWPSVEKPIQETFAALRQLEIEGEAVRIMQGQLEFWVVTPPI